jgi:hypothetical protein
MAALEKKHAQEAEEEHLCMEQGILRRMKVQLAI